MDNEIITVGQLERIAQTNLTFQRFVQRRLFGIQFAVWAFVMAFFLIMPNLVDELPLGWYIELAVEMVVGVAIILVAVSVTTHTSKILMRESELRTALGITYEKKTGPLHSLVWALAIFSTIMLAAVLIPQYFYVVLSLAFAPLAVHLYASLKRTFQARLPIEGVVALGMFSTTVVAGTVVGLYDANWSPDAIMVLWAMTAIVWFLMSLYALFHAPDELGGFNGE